MVRGFFFGDEAGAQQGVAALVVVVTALLGAVRFSAVIIAMHDWSQLDVTRVLFNVEIGYVMN